MLQQVTSDSGLYELRKQCKKFRYLPEALRSLYPAVEIETVIGQLRKIQNTLGNIVDYQVQQCHSETWQQLFGADRHAELNAVIKHLQDIYMSYEVITREGFLHKHERFDSWKKPGTASLTVQDASAVITDATFTIHGRGGENHHRGQPGVRDCRYEQASAGAGSRSPVDGDAPVPHQTRDPRG